jgi:hypothetical protein
LAAGHRERQKILRHKQDFYRIRLKHNLKATHIIHQRLAPPEVLHEEEEASIASVRALDDYHLAQCDHAHARFEAEFQLGDREAIARHRSEIAEDLAGCTAIAIAGGQVATLANRLRMFGINELIDGHMVFAWSGGAMAITDRIVLFHDSPPQGAGSAEVLDRGMALVPDLVVLPQPESRLRLDDPERVGVLANRFAPAQCFAFPDGAHLLSHRGELERPHGVLHLKKDGQCVPLGGPS